MERTKIMRGKSKEVQDWTVEKHLDSLFHFRLNKVCLLTLTPSARTEQEKQYKDHKFRTNMTE
jgi:hypothetical protein